MIKLENVCYSVGKAKIIQDISLEIQAGDFVAIIGENGAGKSTITKLISGLYKPTAGTVFINGKDTKKTRAREMAQNIAYLFQNPDKQICQKTVREELLFGLDVLNVDDSEKEKRLNHILQLFNIDPDAAPFSLSRGQRQMLTFASVLIMQPPILILDEPTTGLDYKECILMMSLVKELNEQGTTVIMVSHDMEVVSDFAKSIFVLNKGTKLAFDSCNTLMRSQDILAKACVSPSQIIALSLCLGRGYENCNTVLELAQEIESRCS